MRISRPQAIAFWNLATNLPTDCTLEILTQEPTGGIIVQAESEGWQDTRRFRLRRMGGYDSLEPEKGQLGALEHGHPMADTQEAGPGRP